MATCGTKRMQGVRLHRLQAGRGNEVVADQGAEHRLPQQHQAMLRSQQHHRATGSTRLHSSTIAPQAAPGATGGGNKDGAAHH